MTIIRSTSPQVHLPQQVDVQSEYFVMVSND